MAKGSGKLLKLKSVLKKWHSMSRLGRTNSSISATTTHSSSSDDDLSFSHHSGALYAVYVGKSRRRYLIASDIIDNPLVKELVDRSGGSDSLTVDCEVVLFEHLLWMLENADPQPESLDELVEFYAC